MRSIEQIQAERKRHAAHFLRYTRVDCGHIQDALAWVLEHPTEVAISRKLKELEINPAPSTDFCDVMVVQRDVWMRWLRWALRTPKVKSE